MSRKRVFALHAPCLFLHPKSVRAVIRFVQGQRDAQPDRTSQINEHTIYPYVHSFSNIPDKTALLRPVTFPDVSPSSLPPNSNFSLVAGRLLDNFVFNFWCRFSLFCQKKITGDFEDIYGPDEYEEGEPQAGMWDAILTCFFIDTVRQFYWNG